MKLESLALWEEKELFGECSDEDKGNRGYCKYIFTPDGVAIRADNMKLVTTDEQYELVNLMHFLEKDEAHFLTRSLPNENSHHQEYGPSVRLQSFRVSTFKESSESVVLIYGGLQTVLMIRESQYEILKHRTNP